MNGFLATLFALLFFATAALVVASFVLGDGRLLSYGVVCGATAVVPLVGLVVVSEVQKLNRERRPDAAPDRRRS